MASMTPLEKMRVLKGTKLFKHCTVDQLLKISLIARDVAFEAHEIIFRENYPGESLYCIAEGKVKLSKKAATKEIILGNDEAFGILAILDRKPRQLTASAVSDCMLLSIDNEDFYELISDHVEIARSIFAFLTGELRRAGSLELGLKE